MRVKLSLKRDSAFLRRCTLYNKVHCDVENYREERKTPKMNKEMCAAITSEFRQTTNLIVLVKPSLENSEYRKFLNELGSYPNIYWKWSPCRRIRRVFVVEDPTRPTNGKIEEFGVKRKDGDSIELRGGRSFSVITGRSLFAAEPSYIYPVEDMAVWAAWEPQSLRSRIERELPRLGFRILRDYADLVDQQSWRWTVERICGDTLTPRCDRPAGSLTEWELRDMAQTSERNKKRVLDHLPLAIEELRALTEMIERDAKR